MHESDVKANQSELVPRPEPTTARISKRINVAFVALILAAGALALSAWAVIRSIAPESAGPPIADEATSTAAKQKACSAFVTVRRGVSLNTNASAPGGPNDVAGGLAVAANARLALFGGGEYLMSQIDAAVPSELREPATEFAETLMDIGAVAISGVPTTEPAQADRLRAAERLSSAIADKCGGH